jgi:hypothetical protein
MLQSHAESQKKVVIAIWDLSDEQDSQFIPTWMKIMVAVWDLYSKIHCQSSLIWMKMDQIGCAA